MRRWIETRIVRLAEWIWKLIPKTRWCISKWAICDRQDTHDSVHSGNERQWCRRAVCMFSMDRCYAHSWPCALHIQPVQNWVYGCWCSISDNLTGDLFIIYIFLTTCNPVVSVCLQCIFMELHRAWDQRGMTYLCELHIYVVIALSNEVMFLPQFVCLSQTNVQWKVVCVILLK